MTLFINTLREPFYDKMIGCTSSKFFDIVVIGERVENDMWKGRIDYPRSANSKTLLSGSGKTRREHQCSDVSFSWGTCQTLISFGEYHWI